jgi:Tfp pilus assembly protein PilF
MNKKMKFMASMSLVALSMTSGCATSSFSGMMASMSPTNWFAKKEPTPAERFSQPVPKPANPSTLGANGRLGAPPPSNNTWLSSLPTPFAKKEVTAAPPTADDPLSLNTAPKQMNPLLFVHLARMHEARGDYDNALKQYEQGLKLDPQNIDVLLGMARTYDRKDDVAQAVATYEKALQFHPQSATANNDLALCYARHREAEKAKQYFERAIALDPQSKLYRNNLATTLVQLGQHEAALTQLSTVHPPAAANYNVGFLAYQVGQKAESAHYFQQALALDPQLAAARLMLEKVQGNATQVATQVQANSQKLQDNLTQQLQQAQTRIQAALPAQPAPVDQRYSQQVAPQTKDYSSDFGSTNSLPPIEPPSDLAEPPPARNYQSLPPITE